MRGLKPNQAVMEENKEESLCEAARNGDVDRVNSLIASGADVTYFDGEGKTPLMYAAENGRSEVVKALLDGGAPWNALSPSNLSAGDFSMENGHQSAFDILLNAGSSFDLVFHGFVYHFLVLVESFWTC